MTNSNYTIMHLKKGELVSCEISLADDLTTAQTLFLEFLSGFKEI